MVATTLASSVPPDSRLTFHPDYEVPLLRSWYRACANPTNDKFTLFAYELNKGHIRQDRPKVTAEKIKIWWKNERQRERRQKSSSSSSLAEPQQGEASSTSSVGEVRSEDGSSVKSRLRTRLKRPRLPHAQLEGSERPPDECIVIEDTSSGEGDVTALQYRSLPPPWNRADTTGTGAGADPRRCSSHPTGLPREEPHAPASTTTASAAATTATTTTPSPRGEGPPHKQGRKSSSSSSSSSSSAPVPLTQCQDHHLLSLPPGPTPHQPGGPASLTWQSHFVPWSAHRVAPGPPALPWPPHYPLQVPQRPVGSRDQGRGEHGEEAGTTSAAAAAASSGLEDYNTSRQLERYRYSQDVPFGSPSGSMDFSSIL